jgi:hypothetical protein
LRLRPRMLRRSTDGGRPRGRRETIRSTAALLREPLQVCRGGIGHRYCFHPAPRQRVPAPKGPWPSMHAPSSFPQACRNATKRFIRDVDDIISHSLLPLSCCAALPRCSRFGTTSLALFASRRQEGGCPTFTVRSSRLAVGASTSFQVKIVNIGIPRSFFFWGGARCVVTYASTIPTGVIIHPYAPTRRIYKQIPRRRRKSCAEGGGVAVTNGESHDGLLAAAIGAGMWWRGPPVRQSGPIFCISTSYLINCEMQTCNADIISHSGGSDYHRLFAESFDVSAKVRKLLEE